MNSQQRKAMWSKKSTWDEIGYHIQQSKEKPEPSHIANRKLREREEYLRKKSFELGMKSRASHSKALSENQ